MCMCVCVCFVCVCMCVCDGLCLKAMSCLCGIGQSAHKMCTDIRLLAHEREIEEPFEKQQVNNS